MAHPSNWNDMDDDAKRVEAERLLNSNRGHLLIGQALAYAVTAMRDKPHPETSNIEDMECIATLFPFYSVYLRQAS